MKRLISGRSIIWAVLLSVLMSCTDDVLPIAVKSVALDFEELTLTVGESKSLTVTINPVDAENQNVKWSSSDKSVASVDDGDITAHKAGTTTITVTAEDGGFKASCTVTVKAPEQKPDDGNGDDSGNDDNGNDTHVAVKSVELNTAELTLSIGGSATLTATVKPENATNKKVAWTSSDSNIASVENGKVTAVSVGTATISVTTEDGNFKASCTVTVNDLPPVAVESVELDVTELSLTVGESATLTATVKPDDAANKNVVWSSSDSNVASVENGKVTALTAGTATITATTEDGDFKASCTVTVKENEPLTLPNNEIWYTTNDGEIVAISETAFNATVISNTYENEKGRIKFSEDITSIGDDAFYDCSNLTSIEIPENVTTFGNDAFYNCSGLTQIEIPSGITSIGERAFDGCSNLVSIEIPDGVSVISKGTFRNCSNLTTIILPESVTRINDGVGFPLRYCGAFQNCSNLTNIVLPSGLTYIGVYAFRGCSGLKTIEIPSNATIGDYAFSGCSGITNIELPSTMTKIGMGVFMGCSSLTHIEIPSSVTSIGEFAFSGSGLTNIEIPEGVTAIKSGTFSGCLSLTSIVIPSNVTVIKGDYVDENGDGTIFSGAFYGCTGLTHIELPLDVNIRTSAFAGCSSLANIKIQAYPIIGFYGDEIFSDYNGNFSGCESGITWTISPSEKTTSVSKYFTNDIISASKHVPINIIIDEGITAIENEAFYGCEGLNGIEIASSVTSIGSKAFYGCSSLTGIEIPSDITSIGKETFSGCSGLKTFNISPSVTSIGDSAFNGCSGLTNLEIPESVTSIGRGVFSGCSNLAITLPVNLFYCLAKTSLYDLFGPVSLVVYGEGAIEDNPSYDYYCYSLKSVIIESGVTSIGARAFYGCSNLTSIEIPESVVSIGARAFYFCSNLTKIKIPEGVTSIGKDTFSGCSSLTYIEIPESVTSIGGWAFSRCSSLTSIEIPESVTSIGNYAFNGCSGLTSIEIPEGVTSIGGSVFKDCSNLTEIYLKPMTPPSSVGTSPFPEGVTIYVPSASVDAYKADSNWSAYASQIVGYDYN